MTIQEIKEIIQVAIDTGIAELEVQRGDNRVWLRRSTPPATQEVVLPAPAQTAPSAALAGVAAGTSTPTTQVPPPEVDPNLITIESPIVGTFYEASAPGAPPFIKVGDTVQPGQVLCIIESMKLMNEIEAEVAGVIVSRLVENERPVEYGQALFTLRKL